MDRSIVHSRGAYAQHTRRRNAHTKTKAFTRITTAKAHQAQKHKTDPRDDENRFAIKGDEDTTQQREFENQLQQRFREQLVGAVGPNRRTTSTELLDNDEETAPLKGDT
ncbi:hypothetical protein B0A48_18546 [Cryoendolithus antarcticus]|uniref:Uncharacterized protein n=1 Tax=Cryoendolithus antarcticus TaxID=1507870 RepID=A0A1V8S889_9PEZI|nr:hypothetical protein B0A48_18546 [Cryoendolithus antarcticus]